MMAPPRPLIESKTSKQLTEILKGNVGIRCSSENFPEKFIMPSQMLWNVAQGLVSLARKKRFERDWTLVSPKSLAMPSHILGYSLPHRLTNLLEIFGVRGQSDRAPEIQNRHLPFSSHCRFQSDHRYHHTSALTF